MAESKSSEKEQQRTSEREQRGMARQTGTDQSRQARGQSMQRRQGYPALLALSPFELMRRMTEDMLGTLGGPAGAGREQAIWTPRIEAFEEGSEFVVRAELPGMNADEVLVDISDDAITIHGERREQHREEREGVVVSEITYGEFNRVVPLPEGVIADSAVATFRDGVLEIRMPAPSSEVRRGRRLEVSQEGQQQRRASGAGAGQGQTTGQGQGSTAQGGSQPERERSGQTRGQGEGGQSR
jgi:HSP20 family protein